MVLDDHNDKMVFRKIISKKFKYRDNNLKNISFLDFDFTVVIIDFTVVIIELEDDFMLVTNTEKLKGFYSYNRTWQLVPTIERTQNGRLFCTFYSGVESETLGNYCVLLKSDDDGITWSEPIAAAYDGEMHRCFDPIVWVDPLQRLWFTWSRGHEDGVYGVICDNPDADELVWSQEFYIGRNVMMNKPTVLSSGEWLFPIAIWNYWYIYDTLKQKRAYYELYREEYFSNKDNLSGANVYVTVDNGKTFKMLGGCRNIQSRSCDEHIVYEKDNGVLVMYIRVNDGIARSFSYDRGKTWTDSFKFLDGPASRFCVKKLKSGRVLLINHYEFKNRDNLTALLSEDDGETFKYKLLLDERSEISYPSVAEGDDGNLYIIYDHERGGYRSSLEEAQKCAREILLAKINESDIISGKLESKGSYLKHIISKLGEYKGKRNLYTEFPEIDRNEFIQTVSKYTDMQKVLATLFVYYAPNFQNMGENDVEKIDLICKKIKFCAIDNHNLSELLSQAVDILENTPPKTDGGKKKCLVNLMIDFLKEDLNKPLDLNLFAKKQSISKYYLCHIFEKTTGFKVNEYRDICRLTKAKELLINTTSSISEICKECGFEMESLFVGEFTRSEGISPQEYREHNKKRA